ncbi:MAG: sigma-70 family RNA polymerase sigma factor [Planctomycetes bacterium]|nr:sigma-70 family RNA polymerase sigma factor [Planctomycetota bacterium]
MDARPDDTPPHALETFALIQRHRAGDRAALDELFARYAERVRRIVRVRMGSFLRSRAEVEDVVQETMLRAFRSLDRYEEREDAKLIDWMARIAENSLRNLFQREHAGKRDAAREVALESLRDKAAPSSLGWDVVADSVPPPDKVAHAEMEEIVDDCLAELPEEQREIILLVDYARADWELVAERTGRASAGAAQQYHRRARVALAAKVERRLRR